MGNLLPGPRRADGPAGLAPALGRGGLPAAVAPRARLSRHARRSADHTDPTTSKPRRRVPVPRPVVGRRLQDDEVATGRRGQVQRPGQDRVGMTRDRGTAGSVSTESTAAVAPSTRSCPDATTTALLAHDEVGHRHDPVVEVLPADQVGDHASSWGPAGRSRRQERSQNSCTSRWCTTSARSPPGRRAGRAGHQQQFLGVPAAPAELGGDPAGIRPQQRGRLVRPAGVPGHLVGRALDASRRPPGSVSSSRLLSWECGWSGSSTATPPGTSPTPTARRTGSEVKYASGPAEEVAGRREGERRRWPVRHDGDHGRHRQRPVEVREEHPARVGRHPRLEPDRVGQPGRIHDQQHQVAAAGVEPLGGQVHLLGGGQVHEAHVVQGRRPHRARRREPPARRRVR